MLEPIGAVDGAPIEVDDGGLLVVTENSIWVIEATRYRRAPRCENRNRPADNTPSVAKRLEDNVWHQHHDARWEAVGSEFRIAIKPNVGPTDGYGIRTGIVEAVKRLG